ncbi:NAD-dependent epimerase/dehydratase family protein [Cellulomonas soli]
MRIVVAGSSGFIGSSLVPHLRAAGHDVQRLVRRPARSAEEITWDPSTGTLDAGALSGADAVVNLAGVNVGDRRLTAARKREVLSSRLQTTELLARTLAADAGPQVLLQASGIGAYGDRGEELLDERAALGSTYFAGVVRDWEAATAPAEAAGVRVAHLRTSIVLDAHGGALARLLPLVRLGLGVVWARGGSSGAGSRCTTRSAPSNTC